MTVTQARATYNHVVHREVVLLSDIDGVHVLKVLISLELLVSESVEPGEGDSQVGRLEEVLHLLAVRVELRRVDLDVWREDPVDDLPLGGGR